MPWPGSLPVKSACFHRVMNALIALSLVLFFTGNEKLSRECVETLRSFAGIDAKVVVLKLFTYWDVINSSDETLMVFIPPLINGKNCFLMMCF